MIRCRDLRAATVAALKAAAIPGISERVYPSRGRKIFPSEGDLLLVYTQELDADDKDTAPVIYDVDGSLVVRAVVQEFEDEDLEDDDQEEALEARLDEITQRVVEVLQPVHGIDGPFDGLVEWIRWRGTRPTISADGEVLRNSRQILFSATWREELPATQPPDELLRLGTTITPPDAANAPALDVSFSLNTRTP